MAQIFTVVNKEEQKAISNSEVKANLETSLEDSNQKSLIKENNKNNITDNITEAKNKEKQKTKKNKGLKFPSIFLKEGQDPYEQVTWEKRSSKISDSNGNTVFELNDVEVPQNWSQLATDIAVSKYFRKSGVPGLGYENSVKQLIFRVSRTIREAGEKLENYFYSKKDAINFENELTHILINQKGAFNSPVWFNCGLYQRYGIEGTGGNYTVDLNYKKNTKVKKTTTAYKNPQCAACFIQSVDDDLMDIFELAKKEARIFKYGSGAGTNFSKIRSNVEKLSGGGYSSGLMSFLEVLDKGAGATKSGGTTRRAAKMVCLDVDHPEIKDFINWKVREERKIKALIDAGYSNDFNGEAYKTVSGQNSNNSVRISDDFLKRVERDEKWNTLARTNKKVINTYNAKEIWDDIAQAAWECADPGIQYDDNIQYWHTCANTDRINASNPCSEFMFLDDSACNLASINLVKFLKEDGSFDLESFKHTAKVLICAQEILVDFSSYPTEKIALNSHNFRPLGLGYANLGTLLMIKGLPYDNQESRNFATILTAIMTGQAYLTSAEIAKNKSPFAGYYQNSKIMLDVMKKHQEKINSLNLIPSDSFYQDLYQEAQEIWNNVLIEGKKHGFRNAQISVLAPTGTIGLLMDCDTTGIEPDFALVKFKKLAGGGYFKIVNQSVPKALKNLGYDDLQIKEIIDYAIGTNSLDSSPFINKNILLKKGFTLNDIKKIEHILPTVFNLDSAISKWVLGEETLNNIGIKNTKEFSGSILKHLGFKKEEIKQASKIICGTMTLEGAPYLKSEHIEVFDCANRCGEEGKRFIKPMAHVNMMAAVQPFISGAISKTVNLPNETTKEEIKDIYFKSWQLGLKSISIYRDGSKLSQPLSGKNTEDKNNQEEKIYSKTDLEEAIKNALSLAPAKRRKLPIKRHGLTIEGKVAGHQIYLRTGEYGDGNLGEIFIDMHKEGATFRSLLNCFAISISLGLQYGVPLEEFVNKFTFTRFEPQGMVDHPNIKQATSILDFIFRILGMEYLGNTDFIHVKPKENNLALKKNHPYNNSNFLLEKNTIPENKTTNTEKNTLESHLNNMMGDAPMCSDCGHTTIRNGSCYRCLNCGSSMGCS